MRAFVALVIREIDERKALLAAAAVASLLPVLAPLLPSTGPNPAADIREAVLWFVVLTLVPLFALLLGATFVGRDLSEARLGFYFSQPLSGLTIWFGKLAAMMFLIWATELIIMLPTMVMAPDPFRFLAPDDPLGPYDPLWYAWLPLWLGPLVVLLLSHAVGVAWRARSAWVVVDFIAFLAVCGGAWIGLGSFLFFFTPGVVKIGFFWLVGWLFVGLLAGGAAQIASGRVDVRRGHRAMSLTVWSILLVAVLCIWSWTWWIRAAAPIDLDEARQVALGSAEWIGVRGPSTGRADFQPRFVMNTADGRWFRAHSSDLWDMQDLVFSRDGSRVVWLAPANFGSSTLMVADLDTENPEGRDSGLVFETYARDPTLSTDGERLAVIQGSTVMVFDIEPVTQLAAAQIDGDFSPQFVAFEDDDRVRIESIDTSNKHSAENLFQTRFLDVEEKRLSDGDEPRIHFRRMSVSHEGGSSLISTYDLSKDEQRLILVDEDTGEQVAELGKMTSWSNIRVIGNRLLVFRQNDSGGHVEIFDGAGVLIHRVDFGDVGAIFDGGEITEDRIVVGLWSWGSDERPSPSLESVIINVADGVSESTLDGYAPMMGLWATGTSAGAWDTGALASRILKGEDHTLHLWDPATGVLKQIIPVVQ